MISHDLIQSILRQYALPLEGIHGVPHRARVLENGRRLSETTGAQREIVELFAVFHDSRRINEGVDDGHGRRGSEKGNGVKSLFLTLTCRCTAYRD